MIVGLIYLGLTLPAIYLHLEYSVKNFGQTFIVKSDKILVRRNGKVLIFTIEQIEKVILYKSASMEGFGFARSPMEYYYFARIKTITNEDIVITCLVSQNIAEILNEKYEIPLERKKSFFCTTFWK